jgi:hypothetical protein
MVDDTETEAETVAQTPRTTDTLRRGWDDVFSPHDTMRDRMDTLAHVAADGSWGVMEMGRNYARRLDVPDAMRHLAALCETYDLHSDETAMTFMTDRMMRADKNVLWHDPLYAAVAGAVEYAVRDELDMQTELDDPLTPPSLGGTEDGGAQSESDTDGESCPISTSSTSTTVSSGPRNITETIDADEPEWWPEDGSMTENERSEARAGCSGKFSTQKRATNGETTFVKLTCGDACDGEHAVYYDYDGDLPSTR